MTSSTCLPYPFHWREVHYTNYDHEKKYNCKFILKNKSVQTVVAYTLNFQTKITSKATSNQHYFILWHIALHCIKYHKTLHIYLTAGL